MKPYLYFLAIFLAGAHFAHSQDIFGEQIWELTEDVNKDGWVDQGDIISIQVNITHNGEATESISIENLFEHNSIELLPHTVSSSKGTIIKGNKATDSSFLIENVALSSPWGYAAISFSAKITSDQEQGTYPITNQTTLITSMGSITTNAISLPRRINYALGKSKVRYPLILLTSLGVIDLLTFGFKKFNVGKLTTS